MKNFVNLYYFKTLDLKGVCINAATASTDDSPFGNAVVITIGFILVVLMIIPMGYFNLDDNIWVQVAAFIIFIAIIIEWTITFFIHGMTVSNVPAFAPNISAVLVFKFFFSFFFNKLNFKSGDYSF